MVLRWVEFSMKANINSIPDHPYHCDELLSSVIAAFEVIRENNICKTRDYRFRCPETVHMVRKYISAISLTPTYFWQFKIKRAQLKHLFNRRNQFEVC